MPDARSPLVAIGALNAALAVAAGAFAAHGLRARLSERALEIFETGARYHMYHALAMILAGLVAARAEASERAGLGKEGAASEREARAKGDRRGASTAGWIFLAGIAIFSGSLYALALTDVKALGAITPLGGLAFLVGWLWLAWAAWRG